MRRRNASGPLAMTSHPSVHSRSWKQAMKKTTPATFEVVDLAGIEKGDRQGLDAKEFRNADALLHVVRAFPDAAGGPARPRADIGDLETELILADLEVIERRLELFEQIHPRLEIRIHLGRRIFRHRPHRRQVLAQLDE